MKLLTLTPDQIQKLLEEMEKEVMEIKKTCLSFAWYMRGGVTYTDVLNMSYEERNEINNIIESNLEVTKKSQLPFF